MKTKSLLLSFAALSIVCTSCTLIGGGLGAIAGGVLGGPKGAIAGAMIGASVGAVADVAASEAREKNIDAQTVGRLDRHEPLTIDDVIRLSEGGLREDLIIDYIRNTRSKYSLSQTQIKRLQDANVSQRIINYMIG